MSSCSTSTGESCSGSVSIASSCECLSNWTLTGYDDKPCTTGCCNPDNDPNGNWCFTEGTCNGINWTYCEENSNNTLKQPINKGLAQQRKTELNAFIPCATNAVPEIVKEKTESGATNIYQAVFQKSKVWNKTRDPSTGRFTLTVAFAGGDFAQRAWIEKNIMEQWQPSLPGIHLDFWTQYAGMAGATEDKDINNFNDADIRILLNAGENQDANASSSSPLTFSSGSQSVKCSDFENDPSLCDEAEGDYTGSGYIAKNACTACGGGEAPLAANFSYVGNDCAVANGMYTEGHTKGASTYLYSSDIPTSFTWIKTDINGDPLPNSSTRTFTSTSAARAQNNGNSQCGTPLHEFGHALGMSHEHQNPNSPFVYDECTVYSYYGGFPNNWSCATTQFNVLPLELQGGYDSSEFDLSNFDPDSIMLYPINEALTHCGQSSSQNENTCNSLPPEYNCAWKQNKCVTLNPDGSTASADQDNNSVSAADKANVARIYSNSISPTSPPTQAPTHAPGTPTSPPTNSPKDASDSQDSQMDEEIKVALGIGGSMIACVILFVIVG